MHATLAPLQQLLVIFWKGWGGGLSTFCTYHHTRHSWPWPVGQWAEHSHILHPPPHRACAGTSLHLRGTQALVHMCAVNASVPLLLLIYLITYASTKAHSCCHWMISASENNESHWTGKYTGSPVGRESDSRWYWVVSAENQHGWRPDADNY